MRHFCDWPALWRYSCGALNESSRSLNGGVDNWRDSAIIAGIGRVLNKLGGREGIIGTVGVLERERERLVTRAII